MYVYRVVEVREKMFGGRMAGSKLEDLLNEHGRQGLLITFDRVE